MVKHKLFTEDENNYSLNTTLNKSGSSGRKPQNKKKTTGTVKTSTPQRNNMQLVQMQISTSQGVGNKRSTFSLISQYLSTQRGSSASQRDSDSESDSMGVAGFFASSNQKLPYSFDEDEEILKFVLKGQRIFRTSSNMLWKNLEQIKKNPKRTFQSLKNRFLRNIKPHLFTTYRHLIPDDETVQKILIKFPDLKKQLGKKVNLITLELPDRMIPLKVSQANSSRTGLKQLRDTPEPIVETDEESTDSFESQHSAKPQTVEIFEELDFHRKVKINGSSLSVLVNLNFKHPSSLPQSRGIYEKFWNLKSKNKLVPCSACGRCGGPEENVASDAESDALISNSVESNKPERSSPKKKVTKRTSKRIQNQKGKKSDTSESCVNSQRSCSPSLLNEVDNLNELDGHTRKNDEMKCKAAGTAHEVSSSSVLVHEADSNPKQQNAVSDEDTDTIYQKTRGDFRKLIDSDEEEILVKKCLRKNRKSIGFDADISVEHMQVDSYFVKSNSPGFESATANTLATASNKTGETASAQFVPFTGKKTKGT